MPVILLLVGPEKLLLIFNIGTDTAIRVLLVVCLFPPEITFPCQHPKPSGTWKLTTLLFSHIPTVPGLKSSLNKPFGKNDHILANDRAGLATTEQSWTIFELKAILKHN